MRMFFKMIRMFWLDICVAEIIKRISA